MEPSSQDRTIAAKADKMANQALSKLLQSDNVTSNGEKNTKSSDSSYATNKQNKSESSIPTLEASTAININKTMKEITTERNKMISNNINQVYQNSAVINARSTFSIEF